MFRIVHLVFGAWWLIYSLDIYSRWEPHYECAMFYIGLSVAIADND